MRTVLRAAIAAALTLGAFGASGCGLGAGEQAENVHLRVTDDFGATTIAEPRPPQQSGSDTVMRLLERNSEVKTRYGGGFVQSIDGRAGTDDDGGPDWFFYVNGVISERGAAAWRLQDHDHVWWDRHRWDRGRIGAVVGSFPEPMRHGSGGKWAGAQLDCRATATTCAAAERALRGAGVAVTSGGDEAGAPTRVVVGPWRKIADVGSALATLREGPAKSGVYAKLGADGDVTALNPKARPVAAAAVGATPDALIAALLAPGAGSVWVVTGPTEAAVVSGVRALTPAALAGRMAVLVRGDSALPLPLGDHAEGRTVGR